MPPKPHQRDINKRRRQLLHACISDCIRADAGRGRVASRRVDDTVHVRTRRSIDAHLLHGADRGRVNRTPGTVYTSRAACVGGAGPDSERALVALIYVASNSTRQRPSPRR